MLAIVFGVVGLLEVSAKGESAGLNKEVENYQRWWNLSSEVHVLKNIIIYYLVYILKNKNRFLFIVTVSTPVVPLL